MASTDSTSSLAGKTALVTGGSQGIGAAIALHFTRKGISGIAITYASNIKAAEETLAKCRAISPSLKTVAVQADLSDPDIGPNLISKTLKGLGSERLDIVVNNAALLNDLGSLEPFEKVTLGNFTKTMQCNVFAPMNIIAAALPHLPPRGGRVINISSIASRIANDDPTMVYGASKAALDLVTKALGNVYGIKTGATFNTVSVGPTASATTKAFGEQVPELMEMWVSGATSEKRMGVPDDIAYIVGFLASEEGRWINGQQLPANGGHRSMLAN